MQNEKRNQTRSPLLQEVPNGRLEYPEMAFLFSKDYLNLETLEPLCGFLPAGVRTVWVLTGGGRGLWNWACMQLGPLI